eukprot:sb/3472111/
MRYSSSKNAAATIQRRRKPGSSGSGTHFLAKEEEKTEKLTKKNISARYSKKELSDFIFHRIFLNRRNHSSSAKNALRLLKKGQLSSKFPGGFAPSTPTGACSPWALLAGALPPTPPPGLRPWAPLWGLRPLPPLLGLRPRPWTHTGGRGCKPRTAPAPTQTPALTLTLLEP